MKQKNSTNLKQEFCSNIQNIKKDSKVLDKISNKIYNANNEKQYTTPGGKERAENGLVLS